jgi:hypothetical protein
MKDLGERIKQAIARIDAMQQELDRRLKELEGEACNLAPWEKAEDYGIVKYTKGGLYDYGYNPSVDPEELPF